MAIKTITAVINGSTVTLTKNDSTGMYEAVVTASADSSFNLEGGYYPVTIKAEDTAGNVSTVDSNDETFGEKLRLFVQEKVKPIVSITAPAADAYVTNANPKISFSISDSQNGQTSGFSGVDTSSCVVKIDGNVINDEIEWLASDNVHTGYVTLSAALSNGEHTLTVDCADNDGNTAETASVTFKVDTIAPELNILSPADDSVETNQAKFTVIGKTTEATSKPVTVSITLNGADCGDVSVGSDGSFEKEITFTKQGVNVIVITATDKAGLSTSVTRSVTFSTTAPVFISVDIAPNPVAAGTLYKISVKMDE